MSKVFFVGATGHIGGAVLDLLLARYPSVEVTALVRNENGSKQLTSKYPNVHPVLGDLKSFDVLASEASKADIVINAAPDITHDAGISAIIRGLETPGRQKKRYYIQTSGAALIWDAPDGSKTGERIWDDVADIEKIISMDDGCTHRATDKLAFSIADRVNVAVVSPAAVYGPSPSVAHPLPLTIPDVVGAIKNAGGGFTISEGLNIHSYIHTLDLAEIYLILVSDALGQRTQPEATGDEPEIWGPRAYYFGGAEEILFADYMAAIVSVLVEKGYIKYAALRKLDIETAARASGAVTTAPDAPPPPPDSWAMHIAIMFGVDMRVRSTRASKLGWQPRQSSLRDTMEEVFGRYVALKQQEWSSLLNS